MQNVLPVVEVGKEKNSRVYCSQDWQFVYSRGKMSSDRALRKQQQLNNLVAAVTKLAKPGDVIVDFCSGGVVLIENKELSLIRAKDRSDELGLNNISFIQANLDYFNGTFNIGDCAILNEIVQRKCEGEHDKFTGYGT
uniref:Uncharacterized protein n=1 Tax=Anas zonorhyncha TaxID=75864 RepID=A0A8B9UYG7_9AVES